MSPDGSQIGYTAVFNDGSYEFRITDVKRRETRAVILRENVFEPVAADWSRDDTNVLCWFRQRAGSVDLVLLSIDTGDARPLYSLPGSAAPHASLSPDGKFVLTVKLGDDSLVRRSFEQRGEVMLIPVDGSAPRPLLADSVWDMYPSWLPDGRHAFFLRPSTTIAESHDGWLAQLGPDMRVERAAAVLPNLGSQFERAAYVVNDAGALQAFETSRSADVYVAPLDLETGDLGAPRRIDPREIGNHVGPAWSPDGRSIAYFSSTDSPFPGGVPRKTLTIKDVQTGRIRRLHLPLAFLGGYAPRWLPDGTDVVVWGRDTDDVKRTGFYKVDVLSSDVTPVTIGDDVEPSFDCAPDGRHFLYVNDRIGLVSLDMVSGARTRVVPHPPGRRIGRFAVGPDGSTIAFVVATPQNDASWTQTLEVWRGGVITAIVHVSSPESLEFHGWTSSGLLLYGRGKAPSPLPLFSVTPEGGPPRPLKLALPLAPNTVSVSPDGRQLAYVDTQRRFELDIEPLR